MSQKDVTKNQDLVARLQTDVEQLKADNAHFKEIISSMLTKPAAWIEEFVPITVVAKLKGRDLSTLKRYAKKYGIGHKCGGRWIIDLKRYSAWENGSPYPKIISCDDE